MYHAIGFGALNVDVIYKVKELPGGLMPGGEVVGRYDEFSEMLKLLEEIGELKGKSGGGQAANTVVALSRMGFETGYIGKVGRDEDGDFLIQSMENVDTSRVHKSGRSGMCIVLLDESSDRSNIILPNSNDTLSYDELDVDYIKNTRFLHLSSFVGDVPFDAQKRVAQAMLFDRSVCPSAATNLISFDPGELYARRGLKALLPIIKNTFIIFPTDREIELMTGKDYKAGARELIENGTAIVACKRGERGSYILSEDEEFDMPTERVTVVDKTGAGDVYAAGFLAGLLSGRSLCDCASMATKAACLSITGYGRESYPGIGELSA